MYAHRLVVFVEKCTAPRPSPSLKGSQARYDEACSDLEEAFKDQFTNQPTGWTPEQLDFVANPFCTPRFPLIAQRSHCGRTDPWQAVPALSWRLDDEDMMAIGGLDRGMRAWPKPNLLPTSRTTDRDGVEGGSLDRL